MSSFQTFYLVLSLIVFALAWFRGGHTERAGVAMLVLAFVASFIAQPLTLHGFRIGEALVDLALFAGVVWLALRRDRWWPMAAAAFAGLTMVAHVAMAATPNLQFGQIRADVASRWGLGVFLVLSLAAGVLERWMAGERPVSEMARWSRSPRRAT